ncbi:DUF2243 domain-containing protein [Chelativorans sp. ZYF759]|uniref:DUF2243 domain-containing protein n=1 Tax=Chelativorans sp. ZYF759 TaxID=2692213 RepID=UPI0034D679C0
MIPGTGSRSAVSPFSGSYRWSGYALGFAIGGFFDGILLHQILQWHHLLSALDGAPYSDLRFQILADGVFHALMYAVGGVGLWLLWRSRSEFGRTGADRLLYSNALIGFGAWHVIDAVASHWLLGIHRIRMDSEFPLLWDLIWVVAFGLVPLLIGWLIRPDSDDAGLLKAGGPASLAALAIVGGVGAALPPGDVDNAPLIVVFAPGTTASDAFAAMASVDGRLVWSDATDQVWAIDVPPGRNTAGLYGRGALLVSNSLVPLGCLDWFRS